MEVDGESGVLTLNNELIKESVIQSMEAHKQSHSYFITIKKHGAGSSSSSEASIFAFKGSLEDSHLYHNDDEDKVFGLIDVPDLFNALRRVGEDKRAKVNNPLLQDVLDIFKDPKFKLQVEKAVTEGKKILFTGHSTGGALASLATLWVLDEYKRKLKKKFQIGCVTFGSPLIGDGNLAHSVRREKWAGHFTHFVMEHDIIPRMMLAPKTSIQDHLPTILNFYQQKLTATTKKSDKFSFLPKKTKVKATDPDQLVDADQAVAFFENVMINASTAASHDAFDLMEPTNSLKDKLSADFVKVSPYRPFGIYVFCTRDESHATPGTPRQQLVVENPNAVLQLLFYFLQLPNEDQDLAEFANNSLAEHSKYEEELNKKGLQLDNRANLKDLNEHLLTSNGTSGDMVRKSNKSLFELDETAKWCLIAVEKAEERKKENEEQLKRSMKKYSPEKAKDDHKIIEDISDQVREYKNKKHAGGEKDYYEAFKNQNNKDDFVANVNRLEQAKIWDVIIEMLMRKDLPDEFEGQEEWVTLGTEFRRLLEPLDIANYYRHAKGDGYLDFRPKRYKFTQRWYEHANVTQFKKISESNFVAQVEELMKDVELKKKPLNEVKKEFETLEELVQRWKSEIPENDVFWGESILSKLREKLQ